MTGPERINNAVTLYLIQDILLKVRLVGDMVVYIKCSALIINHELSVCSNVGNQDGETQNGRGMRGVSYSETQQMFPQISVHKIVFSCCFCMMKVYTQHVLVINFLV